MLKMLLILKIVESCDGDPGGDQVVTPPELKRLNDS